MPIPALIVSGYLGSGKTTLVGHLLKQAQAEGVRLAIISNEFGDTGIDRALLDAGEQGFVELDGGCVCCRLSDELSETVESIVLAAKPDRLVLETSGVALPGEIVVQFWRPPLDTLIEDESVVVLVDGERLLQDEQLEATFLEQLEAADLVVLNKCDLIDPAQQDAAEARLRALTHGQDVVRAVRGQLDAADLFPGVDRTARRDPEASIAPHSHERFNTFEVAFPDGLSDDELVARVRAQGAVRAKGFVRTPAGVRVVQGVGARVNIDEPDNDVPDHLVGRVVFIKREEGEEHHHG